MVKMWKHNSGVSKVVNEKKNKKGQNVAHDMRECEKIRTRKFSTK